MKTATLILILTTSVIGLAQTSADEVPLTYIDSVIVKYREFSYDFNDYLDDYKSVYFQLIEKNRGSMSFDKYIDLRYIMEDCDFSQSSDLIDSYNDQPDLGLALWGTRYDEDGEIIKWVIIIFSKDGSILDVSYDW